MEESYKRDFPIPANFSGLKVLQTRAYSMQEASDEVGSGMMTVSISHQSKLGLAKEAAIKYCKTECNIMDPVVQTASYLTPYHKVVAGHIEVCMVCQNLIQ